MRKFITRNFMPFAVASLCVMVAATAGVDFYERFVQPIHPAPVAFKAPTYHNGAGVDPGGLMKLSIPVKRTKVCTAQVERVWRRKDNLPIVSYYEPISRFVEPSGVWKDFKLTLAVPYELNKFRGETVELDMRVISWCDGRQTEIAMIPPVEVLINE